MTMSRKKLPAAAVALIEYESDDELDDIIALASIVSARTDRNRVPLYYEKVIDIYFDFEFMRLFRLSRETHAGLAGRHEASAFYPHSVGRLQQISADDDFGGLWRNSYEAICAKLIEGGDLGEGEGAAAAGLSLDGGAARVPPPGAGGSCCCPCRGAGALRSAAKVSGETCVALDSEHGAGPLRTTSAKLPFDTKENRFFASEYEMFSFTLMARVSFSVSTRDSQDTRLREAGAEAVYCLARGAPKGPNIPWAQLNHQGPLFPGHGYATHSQTWVGEPTWLGVLSDATHQAPTKAGAPCVRVWWPTRLGSVVTLLTKHLAPKVQAPPAEVGVRGDATLQTPAFTGLLCRRALFDGSHEALVKSHPVLVSLLATGLHVGEHLEQRAQGGFSLSLARCAGRSTLVGGRSQP
ncbi:hypothetical protein ISCGN_022730 [Ixodes scapularis]